MKKNYGLTVFIILVIYLTESVSAQIPELTSVFQLTGNNGKLNSSGQMVDNYSMVYEEDPFGNLIVYGSFKDTLDMDLTSGQNLLVADSAVTNLYMAKYDALHNLLWAKKLKIFYTYDFPIASLKIDSIGNVFIYGTINRPSNFDPSTDTSGVNPHSTDLFLARYDGNNGSLDWAFLLGPGGNENANGLEFDAAGNLCIAGGFEYSVDFDPSANNASLSSMSLGWTDLFFAKYSPDGAYLLAKRIRGTNLDRLSGFTVDGQSNFYLTGTIQGQMYINPSQQTADASSANERFLAKFDMNGNYQWHRIFKTVDVGSSSYEIWLGDMDFNPEGDLILSGQYQANLWFNEVKVDQFNHNQATSFIASLNQSSGQLNWIKQLGMIGQSNSYGILEALVDNLGNYCVLGTIKGAINLDSNYPEDSLYSTLNQSEYFLAGYDRFGNINWRTLTGLAYSPANFWLNIVKSRTGAFRLRGFTNLLFDIDITDQTYTIDPQIAPMDFESAYNYTGIIGTVYEDIDGDCVRNENEKGLARRLGIIQPSNYIVQTNENGIWYLDSLPPGNYTITYDTPDYWDALCGTSQSFQVISSNQLVVLIPHGMKNTIQCSKPEVSIVMPRIRRCFQERITVKASNHATANAILQNASVIVKLDALLSPVASSIPYTDLGNNNYEFHLLDTLLYPNQQEWFWIDATVSCATVLGQTLCLEAEIIPVDSCVFSPSVPSVYSDFNQCSLPWDGSDLIVDGWCEQNQIIFVVKNQAASGVGDMQCYAPVRIFSDGVYVLLDSVQLNGGETDTIHIFGNGKTWRIQLAQHPLYPAISIPNATVERCGDSTNWVPNLVNLLPVDETENYRDTYCEVARGSYDPNDKTGYPLGIGSQHKILPNGEIEYFIRFQNTGTDTAFTVVIRDTLDQDLDIYSVIDGASSHSGKFRIYGQRILEWRFENILLPDSNTNEALSHGFVTFRVKQNPDLIDGSQIINDADIYFDYNDPVITNATNHQIDRNLSQTPAIHRQEIEANACGQYDFQQQTLIKSGSYLFMNDDPVQDTIRVLDLTIGQPTFNLLTQNVCSSYTAPDGQIYTTSGTYTSVIPNALGCDSTITINLTVRDNSTDILNEIVCGSYTGPNGAVYSNSGTYNFNFTNAQGCDSVITVNLTVKKSSSSVISEDVCGSYTAPDGQVYTSNGAYIAIIPNHLGCDSNMVINLIVRPVSFETQTINTCQSYTAPDGQVYTTSGTYSAIIPNTASCDSTIIIDLTVNNPSSSNINESVCGSYTAPDGQIYTTSGNYTAIIPTATGCDSTITINLTVNNPSTSNLSETVCKQFIAADGQIFTTSGNYDVTIQNAAGCDSTINYQLTINQVDTETIVTGSVISANATGAIYQWLDCGTAMDPISGETSQSYNVIQDGVYAVLVTQNGCTDTSNCVTMSSQGVNTLQNGTPVLLYPNPTDGLFHVDLGQIYSKVTFKITDIQGRTIKHEEAANQQYFELELKEAAGVYLVHVLSENQELSVIRLIKN